MLCIVSGTPLYRKCIYNSMRACQMIHIVYEKTVMRLSFVTL